MGIMSSINLDLLCRLLQEVHRACYVKLSGATVDCYALSGTVSQNLSPFFISL